MALLTAPSPQDKATKRGSALGPPPSASPRGSNIPLESASVKVCIRVRPWIKEETEGRRNDGEPLVACIAMDTTTSCTITGQKKGVGQVDDTFDYDRCYWSHTTQHPLYAHQAIIYDELGEDLLQNAIYGYNNCLFAYGQTGSGKSFSVLGDVSDGATDNAGLLPRLVRGLFDHHTNDKHPETYQFKCMVSFLEIYQEVIADLLIDDKAMKERSKTMVHSGKLAVREHPKHGTFIPGLTEVAVGSRKEVMDLLQVGLETRQVAETAMNATSSRSHCIFTFKTAICEQSDGIVKNSQTHIVDLAGSERAKRTEASGERLKEGASINSSLSALAHVISELAKKGTKAPPFRTSRLTHILKDSLSGNSKTVMIAAISPSARDYSETLSTLKFAQTVKKVQTQARVNKVNEKALDATLLDEIEKLRAKLQEYETSHDADLHKIEYLEAKMADSKALYQSMGRMRSDNWNESLEEDRAMIRRRTALRETALEAAGLQKLLEIHEKFHGNDSPGTPESVSTPERAMSPQAARDPLASLERPTRPKGEDAQPEVLHIKLQNLTLDELRANWTKLEGESEDVAELSPTPVSFTPMLALSLSRQSDGSLQAPHEGISNFVVKRQCDSPDNGAPPSPDRADEEPPQWLSEDQFQQLRGSDMTLDTKQSNMRRFRNQQQETQQSALQGTRQMNKAKKRASLKAVDDLLGTRSAPLGMMGGHEWAPKSSASSSDPWRAEQLFTEGEELQDDRFHLAAASKSPVKGRVASRSPSPTRGDIREPPMSARGDIREPPMSARGESREPPMSARGESREPLMSARGDIRERSTSPMSARGDIRQPDSERGSSVPGQNRASPRRDLELGPSLPKGFEDLQGMGTRKTTADRLKQRYKPKQRDGLFEYTSEYSEQDGKESSWSPGNSRSASPDTRRRASSPDEYPSRSRSESPDGHIIDGKRHWSPKRSSMRQGVFSEEMLAAVLGDEMLEAVPSPTQADEKKKIRPAMTCYKAAKPIHGYAWGEDTRPKKTEAWMNGQTIDMRPGAGVRKTKTRESWVADLRKPAAEPEPRNKKLSTNPKKTLVDRRLHRSAAYHWMKALSNKDPNKVTYAEALDGMNPSSTLLEAMKDRRVADTVQNKILCWPGLPVEGGDISVNTTLQVLWQGGVLEDSLQRRRSHSQPAWKGKAPSKAKASRTNAARSKSNSRFSCGQR